MTSYEIRVLPGIPGSLVESALYPPETEVLIEFAKQRHWNVMHSPIRPEQVASRKDISWTLPVLELLTTVPLSIVATLLSEYILHARSQRKGQSDSHVSARLVLASDATGATVAVLDLRGSQDEVLQVLDTFMRAE